MSGLLGSPSSGRVQEHRKVKLLEIRFDVRVTVHPEPFGTRIIFFKF